MQGGGKAITRAMDKAGIKSEFRGGMRVTDAPTVKIVEETLNIEINGQICESLKARGANPLGMPGNHVNLCEKLLGTDDEGKPVDIGFVGDIKFVKTKLIKKALADGFLPVVSPIALDADDQAYNTNADVPGLLADAKDPASLITTLKVSEVDELKRKGVVAGGMITKVDSAVKALQEGVRRVHFIDGRVPHALLLEVFTDKGIGTEIIHG